MSPVSVHTQLANTSKTALEVVENEQVSISLHNNNLIIIHYHADCEVDVSMVHYVRDTIKKLIGNDPFRLLVFADYGVNFTKEGRERSAELDKTSPLTACAAVTDNLGHVIMINFFRKVYKPRIPFKVFRKVSEATEWLSHF